MKIAVGIKNYSREMKKGRREIVTRAGDGIFNKLIFSLP
jgi:hypothetical protein